MATSVVPDVPDYVASGEEAWLIPVLADKNKERRALARQVAHCRLARARSCAPA